MTCKLEPHKDEIIRLRKDGISCREIGKIFKVSTSTISLFFKKYKVKPSDLKFRKLKNHKDEIIERYVNGESGSSIAKRFDSSNSCLFRFLRHNNVKIRTVGKQSHQSKFSDYEKDIVSMYKDHRMSIYKISKVFDCCFTTVYKILKRKNVLEKRSDRYVKFSKLLPYEKEIIETYNTGVTLEELQNHFPMFNSAVLHKFLKSRNIKTRSRKRDRRRVAREKLLAHKEKILKMYNDGDSINLISKTFNVSHYPVVDFIKEFGNYQPNRKCYRSVILLPYKEEIIRMCENGLSTRNIANVFDVNPSTVFLFLKKNKIKTSYKEKVNKNDKLFAKLYKSGVPVKKIVEKYNTTISKVYRGLHNEGVELICVGSNLTKGVSKLDPHKEEVIRLYKEGKSINEMAEIFGCSYSVVYRFLKKNKMKINKKVYNRSSKLDPYKEEIISLYNKGLSIDDIVEKFNASRSTIYTFLKKNNIKTKGPRYIKDKYKKIKDYEHMIIELHNSGFSPKEIIEKTKLPRSSVYKILRNYKLTSS